MRTFWTQDSRDQSVLPQEAIARFDKVGAFLADLDPGALHRSAKISGASPDDEERSFGQFSKGELGETARISLCASRLTIGLAAFSRAEQPESERKDFFVYLDEFQNSRRLQSPTWCQSFASIGGLVLRIALASA